MILDQKEKELLRKQIKEKLENAEINKRISIEKEILEQLIFDVDGKKWDTYRFFNWSGDILSKIDMSEVTFDKVAWCTGVEKILSGTNAKIDFSKRYIEKKYNLLSSCVLSNMDLTTSGIEGFSHFNFVDLEKATLPEGFGKNQIFDRCNFKNSNLNIEITSNELYTNFNQCNFSGTATTIIHKKKNLTEEEEKLIKEYKDEMKSYKISEYPHISNTSKKNADKIKENHKYLIEYYEVCKNLDEMQKAGYLEDCNIVEVLEEEKVIPTLNGESFKKLTKSLLDSIDKSINSLKK